MQLTLTQFSVGSSPTGTANFLLNNYMDINDTLIFERYKQIVHLQEFTNTSQIKGLPYMYISALNALFWGCSSNG